jgi:hypothetical protein
LIDFWKISRLLKNAHLRRSLKYASGRLTNSPAWQEVAPYSPRRHSQDFGSLASGIFEPPLKIDFLGNLLAYEFHVGGYLWKVSA